MLQDALATFSTAQVTAAASYASTDILDNTISGAYPTGPDAYVGNWFVVRLAAVATVPNGAATLQFQLQTSISSTFNQPTDVTLCQSVAYYYNTLNVAGKFFAARIPSGMQRYVRAYYVQGTANSMNGVTTDAFIVKDIDLTMDKRFLIR